jgi:hypothetical protein
MNERLPAPRPCGFFDASQGGQCAACSVWRWCPSAPDPVPSWFTRRQAVTHHMIASAGEAVTHASYQRTRPKRSNRRCETHVHTGQQEQKTNPVICDSPDLKLPILVPKEFVSVRCVCLFLGNQTMQRTGRGARGHSGPAALAVGQLPYSPSSAQDRISPHWSMNLQRERFGNRDPDRPRKSFRSCEDNNTRL